MYDQIHPTHLIFDVFSEFISQSDPKYQSKTEELEAVTRDCQIVTKAKMITLIFNVDLAASLFQHQILQSLVKQYKWSRCGGPLNSCVSAVYLWLKVSPRKQYGR